jgi:hypothetical protein
MNALKKLSLFIFSCLALTNVSIQCLLRPGRSTAARGALWGGVAGGGKGAAIGMAVGGTVGRMRSAAAADRPRYEADYYESRRDRGYRDENERLRRENEELRRQQELE